MIQCSRVLGQIGKEILEELDDLGVIDAHRNGIYISFFFCFRFLPFFFFLLEQPPSVPRDQIGPSSDISIGPSQSASQIIHPFPEPVQNPTTTTSPELQSPTGDMGLAPPEIQIPRRHSVASTSHSSLYHTPGTPATYKVETVTYAPAVSLVVPPSSASLPSSPRDMNIPLASTSFGIGLPPPINYASETEEVHTTMYIPAAHAISEYEMPTAKVAAESGGGNATLMGWRHSRGESQSQEEVSHHLQRVSSLAAPAPESTLPHTSSEQKAVPITAAGSALIENFDESEHNMKEEEEEDFDSVLSEELIKQGKLAVVENPRFMSEQRRKELEKKSMKQPDVEQQKSEEPELEPAPEEKKSFSFLPQHKRTGTQDTSGRVSFATPTPKSSPSKGGGETLPYTSPSKTSPSKRFLGSLKGLFGGSRPSPEDSSPPRSRFRAPPPTPSPIVNFNNYLGEDDGDDGEYSTTTKTRGSFQTFLWGTGGGAALKKNDGGGGGGRRWSTRTDRNIRKLAKNGVGDDDDDEYETYLSQGSRNKGVAGDMVDGVRFREVKNGSTTGTATTPANGSAVTGGGRKKLKKTVPAPIVTAGPPTSALQISSTPQWNETTRDQTHVPADPSRPLRKSSVKTDGVPRKRSASVDESMRRRTSNMVAEQGVGEVGQTTPAGGVVDLGKRRRVSSSVIPATNPPAAAVGVYSARGIPASTRTPSAAVGTSAAVSKGYSSDTAAVRAARAPPTVVAPAAPAAATATSSKPTTLTRQPSVGKTQTHPTSTSNLPVENATGSRHQPPHPHPQPHRQHSASSSVGGAIVLTAGATQPTGTLVSRPGWDAQALPTAGGGLSRNNSVLSGVSGVAGGSSSGGKKKQRETSLGHGMGSGARRSSLGSSSGHGGGGGGGGSRPVVQPAQPAQSLMSIIEDVAKHNRDWSQESSILHKNRNRIVSGGGLLEKEGPVVGMVDVVKAPRRFGRDELAQLDPAMIKARLMDATGSSGSGGRGRMVDVKAPGSIFDQQDAVGSAPVPPKLYRQPSSSTPELTQRQQQTSLARRPSGTIAGPAATSTPVARSKRPAKSPLRSAMKNPSRTPSPLTSPFLVQKQQQAIQEGSRLAVKSNVVAPVPVPPAQYSTILGSQEQLSSHTPSAATDIQSTAMVNGRAASASASQRRKGKREVKGTPDEIEAGESTSANDTEDEIFYTDDENVDDDDEYRGEAEVVSTTDNQGAAPPLLNGHAVGYTGGSDLSQSTTSTAVHRHPAPTTTSPTTAQPRRRKSVRVSLQPTFSPSPPAVEYDDDKEEQRWASKEDFHHHYTTTEGSVGGGQQQQQQLLHVHAPVPVAANSSLLLNPAHQRQQKAQAEPAHDIWEDSDEDVEYQNAKLLLTRAAKKEKEMKLFAARIR